MRRQKHNRVGLIAGAIVILIAAIGSLPSAGSSRQLTPESTSAATDDSASLGPQRIAGGGDYFLVRADVRRCASPLCGGYWVSRVNNPQTRCANGRWSRECYVAEIDWRGRVEIGARKALLRGSIIPRRYPNFGNLGAFRVTESWQSTTETPPNGIIFRVRDRGLRCITHPCLTHSATKLNGNFTRNIAGADLAASGASDEQISEAAAAMTKPEGVLVAGYFAPVTGPGGRAQTLKAAKFYLPAERPIGGTPPSGSKPCFKTGCSSQVCADENVMTTCEYRTEYDCYKKAICERQRNGECGFTQTPELRACLERARRSSQ